MAAGERQGPSLADRVKRTLFGRPVEQQGTERRRTEPSVAHEEPPQPVVEEITNPQRFVLNTEWQELRAERLASVTHQRLFQAVTVAPIVLLREQAADPDRIRDEMLAIGRSQQPPRLTLEWTPAVQLTNVEDGLAVPLIKRADRVRTDDQGRPLYRDPRTGRIVVEQPVDAQGRPVDPIEDPFFGVHRVETLQEVIEFVRTTDQPVNILMPNFHLAVRSHSNEMWQMLAQVSRLRDELIGTNKSIVITAPHDAELPKEMNGLYLPVPNLPPTFAERQWLTEQVLEREGFEGVSPELVNGIADAVEGLTVFHADNVIQMALVRNYALDEGLIREVETIKTDLIIQEGLWTPQTDNTRGIELIGYERYHETVDRLIEAGGFFRRVNLICLVGQAGTGKTTAAKQLAEKISDTMEGRKFSTYVGNVESWAGQYVGDTEAAWARAVAQAQSLKGVFVFDEVQRSMGGMDTDNKTSGGAFNRGFGKLLTAITEDLANGAERVYVVTANEISDLPPEFINRGLIFSVNFNGPQDRHRILQQKIDLLQRDEPGARVQPALLDPRIVQTQAFDNLTRGLAPRDIERLVGLAHAFGNGEVSVRSMMEARKVMATQADIQPERIAARDRMLARIPSVGLSDEEKEVRRVEAAKTEAAQRSRRTQEQAAEASRRRAAPASGNTTGQTVNTAALTKDDDLLKQMLGS